MPEMRAPSRLPMLGKWYLPVEDNSKEVCAYLMMRNFITKCWCFYSGVYSSVFILSQ